VKGDLLMGADRVHSVTRKKVSASGKDVKPYGSGKSAFRLKPGELIIW